jgi:hypothetical protein
MIEHTGARVWQIAGLPAQRPVQQSSFVAQGAPISEQDETQTDTPASVGVQEPLQQVSPTPHGALRGRQGPGPKVQRPVDVSHAPQHGGTSATPPVHSSPGSRHRFAVRRQICKVGVHSPEQQSAFTLQ